MSSNVAILLTPPGVAAIAVVRLRGPAMSRFLTSHFSKAVASSRPVHGILRDERGQTIDDPVVVLAADASFADLNLHGGSWVIRATLHLASRTGFECLERLPMPLPDEALDATDLIEHEIEASLPLATTELALRVLLAQSRAWRELLARQPDASEIRQILADRSLHWLLHAPRVAIVGAANVGKSTLANRLFAQERSITADVPGTTRDWVGEIANLDGLPVQLVDTPGIRQTTDAIEQEAIQRSGEQIRRADLVILALDASRPMEPEQTELLKRFPDALRVVNKIDAPHAWDISSLDSIHTDAKTGHGVDDLMRRVRAHFQCDQIDLTRPRCWTERQTTELSRFDAQHSTSSD